MPGVGSVKHQRFYRAFNALVVSASFVGCAPPPAPPKKPEIARVVPPPPPVPAAEEPEEIAVATVRDADRVVAALRPRFRSCYERGRRERGPRISGRMMLVASVRDDGTVKSARVRDVRGLPTMVTECVARQMRGAKFAPPGGAARLEVPVLFVRHD